MVDLPRPFRNAIKLTSTVLIAAAIALELWNLYERQANGSPIAGLHYVFIVGRIALISHGVEAAIAAVAAPSRQQSALSYGLYTFFVGTIGLLELFQTDRQPS